MKRSLCFCLLLAATGIAACKTSKVSGRGPRITEPVNPETKDETVVKLQPSPQAVASWQSELEAQPWNISRGNNVSDAALDNRTLFLWDRESGLSSLQFDGNGVTEKKNGDANSGDAWVFPSGGDILVLKKNTELLVYERETMGAGPKASFKLGEWTSITAASLIEQRFYVGGMTSSGPAVVAYQVLSSVTPASPPAVLFRMKPTTLPQKIYFEGSSLYLVGKDVVEHHRMITETQALLHGQYPAAYSRVVKARGFFYGLRSDALHVLNPADFTPIAAPLNAPTGAYPGGTQLVWDQNETLYQRKADGSVRSYRILTDGALQPYEEIASVVYDGWLLASRNAMVAVNTYGASMVAFPAQLNIVTTYGAGVLWNTVAPLWIDEKSLLVTNEAGLLYEVNYRYGDISSRVPPDASGSIRAAVVKDFYLYLADSLGIKAYDRRQTPWVRLPELDFATATPARQLTIIDDFMYMQLSDGLYRKKLGDGSVPVKLLPTLNGEAQFCASATHLYVNDINSQYLVDLGRPFPNNLVRGATVPNLQSCLIQGDRLLNMRAGQFEIFNLADPLAPKSLVSVTNSSIPALRKITPTALFWKDGTITSLQYLANFSRDPALQGVLDSLPLSLETIMVVARERVLRVKEWKPLEW